MIEVVADLVGRIVAIGRYSNRNSVINHTGACSSVNWICLYLSLIHISMYRVPTSSINSIFNNKFNNYQRLNNY